MFPFCLIPLVIKARRDFESSFDKKPLTQSLPVKKNDNQPAHKSDPIDAVCDYENVLSVAGIGTREDFNRTYKVKQILSSKRKDD